MSQGAKVASLKGRMGLQAERISDRSAWSIRCSGDAAWRRTQESLGQTGIIGGRVIL